MKSNPILPQLPLFSAPVMQALKRTPTLDINEAIDVRMLFAAEHAEAIKGYLLANKYRYRQELTSDGHLFTVRTFVANAGQLYTEMVKSAL